MAQSLGISKLEEGDFLHAYPDPASGGAPWTIGYGSTRIFGRAVLEGDVITEADALAQAKTDLMQSMQLVIAYTMVPLTGDQLGALTSFMNNVGPGKPGVKDGFVWLKDGSPSTMRRMVNAGNFAGAAEQFPLWVMGNGRPMGGLIKRRALEREMFLGQLDMTGGAEVFA
ncbi:MAG: hypothetical protein B7Z80_18090 [Rhodospirillales bacterium 20-64-7]|nr:MAG: hypothetical protein B7Z80_18090 [Rhodospirillales bacterium 20-64-7]